VMWMIKVLIVDDSVVAQKLMEFIFQQDPKITVIGTAQNGKEAILAVQDKKPDLVTMDINMPVMNGFEATRIIMETTPVPILIVTGNENIKEVATSFAAIEAGALTLMARPPGIHHPEFETSAKALCDAVKTYAEIKLVRRYHKPIDQSVLNENLYGTRKIEPLQDQIKLVAIGASTGGPIAIQTLLFGFGNNFPLPVVIVQHIARGFSLGFADWLRETTGFLIHVADEGENLLPGHAYIAPDGCQMGVNDCNQITLIHDHQENGLCPSVAYLFRSVRQVYKNRVIAILLTGMGRDGADELKRLKDCGAVTIAQDEESSVIFGMPEVAIRLGAATYILSPKQIVDTVYSFISAGGDDNGNIP